MSVDGRLLYRSSSGDRWSLVRDADTGRPMVLHEANAASGGHHTRSEVGAFLASGGAGPEHQELLRLIGTLAPESTPTSQREPDSGGPERKHIDGQEGYQVDELAQAHGITNDQASRLIRQIGTDRDKLDEEAERLRDRRRRVDD